MLSCTARMQCNICTLAHSQGAASCNRARCLQLCTQQSPEHIADRKDLTSALSRLCRLQATCKMLMKAQSYASDAKRDERRFGLELSRSSWASAQSYIAAVRRSNCLTLPIPLAGPHGPAIFTGCLLVIICLGLRVLGSSRLLSEHITALIRLCTADTLNHFEAFELPCSPKYPLSHLC